MLRVWFSFALAAALLTSFLPIINKRLLRDTDTTVVVWSFNAISLPILVIGTLLETKLPSIDLVYVLAVVASGAINWLATLASTQALKVGEASLVTPLLTFNPPFTLLVGYVTLGEVPTRLGLAGVLLIAMGAYMFELESIRRGVLEPVMALLTRPGVVLAVGASFLWALTPVAEKVAIQHSTPQNSASVALATTAIMVGVLTVSMAQRASQPFRQVARHPWAFVLAGCIAGVAPLFGFAAIAGGIVGYVTALFKLGAVATVVWSGLLLGERGLRKKLPTLMMVLGSALVAS